MIRLGRNTEQDCIYNESGAEGAEGNGEGCCIVREIGGREGWKSTYGNLADVSRGSTKGNWQTYGIHG